MGFWINWSLTCKYLLHLSLKAIIIHIWILWVFTHESILGKPFSNTKEHNGKMLPFNIQYRTCRVNHFYRKENNYIFWMNCLRNSLFYILSSFIYIFHVTNGHSHNLLLVDIKAFVTSCVHCMACDFTNPAKVADLKLLRHITSPEKSVLHCCAISIHIHSRSDLQNWTDLTKLKLNLN